MAFRLRKVHFTLRVGIGFTLLSLGCRSIIVHETSGGRSEYMVTSDGDTLRRTDYTTNGIKQRVLKYRGGQLDGVQRAYFSSGVLMKEGRYDDGLPVGKQRTYFPNGQLEFVEMLDDGGNNIGLYKEFHSNGRMKVRGQYDLVPGYLTAQCDTSKALKTSTFEYGSSKVGTWQYFDTTGNLDSTEYYGSYYFICGDTIQEGFFPIDTVTITVLTWHVLPVRCEKARNP